MNQDGRDKMGTEWMGLKQLTLYANLSERTLRAWIHSAVNPLPAVRVAGKILVKRSELDAWLARHRVKALETLDLDGIVREVSQGVTHGRQSPKT
jgi:excisionase family DNA binding protein